MLPISICIIGKNEQKNIEACLASIPKNKFEIVYVDTGSTDSTKKIAQKYTNNIFDFKWINDFSAARNFSIQKATNDWVLIIDCDETITSLDHNFLSSYLPNNKTKVGEILIESKTNGLEGANTSLALVNRLFNRRFFHYESSIHEQVTPLEKNLKVSTFDSHITFYHTGYFGSPEFIESKMNRNITLLEKKIERSENPSEIPYWLYQLGQSYYTMKDYENALIYFDKALSFDVNPELDYVQRLIVSYGYTLCHTGRINDARIVCEEVYSNFKTYADFIFLCGYIYLELKIYDQAILSFILSTTLTKGSTDVSIPAYYNLGQIYEVLGDYNLATSFFKKSINFQDSKARIDRLSKYKKV